MDAITKIYEKLTTTPDLQIKIDAKPDQKFFRTKAGGNKLRTLAVFRGDDSISGVVVIDVKPGQQFQHFGVKILLQGYLEIYEDSSLSTEFNMLAKQLLPAGTIKSTTTLKFKFQNFDKDYQSFYGVCGQVRYSLKAIISLDKYLPNITHQIPLAVHKPQPPSTPITPITLHIGTQGKVNISLSLQKSSYSLHDTIKGYVLFTEVKATIKNMELWVVRKEKLGSDKLVQNDTQTLIQYQIMDGSPEEGDQIPVRLFLRGVKGLGPSFTSLHGRLSVSYLIKIVIVDILGKKYFKEAPIHIYRQAKEPV